MSITLYPVRWRLVYLDGRTQDEPPAGATILERWAEPVELQLIDFVGESFMRVLIPPGYRPIFYRQRSLAQEFAAATVDHATVMSPTGQVFTSVADRTPRLDVTVFGYGREGKNNFEGKLWACAGGKVVNCPPRCIAEGAISLQTSLKV